MNAIVLSPGPSLANYEPRSCDFSIGINRAAIRFEVDYWCCGDTPAVMNNADRIAGSPKLVTYSLTADALNDHKFVWRNEVIRWTQMADNFLHPSVVNWPWSSFLAGVTFAAFKGATRIDVYGADWEGTLDFDGVEAGKNRGLDRWREEASIFGALQIVLGKRGHEIRRVLPTHRIDQPVGALVAVAAADHA